MDDNEKWLQETEARAAKATPGPWRAVQEGDTEYNAWHLYTQRWIWYPRTKSTFWSEDDMKFAAHARDDVPRLIDKVRSLQADLAASREREGKLRAALGVLMDQVDFEAGACNLTAMIGSLIDKRVLDNARRALEEGE